MTWARDIGSKRRNDKRSLDRRKPTRQPRRRILVVCEGKATEPGYIKAFQHAVRNLLVHVELAPEQGVPPTVVQIAIRLRDQAKGEATRERDENLRYDEVWGVFDVDEHPNLEQARTLAASHDIELAVSNPCFELWALHHFQDQRAHIDRGKVRTAFKRHQSRYNKALDFSMLYPGYPDAVRRAHALDREAERLGKPGCNPSTGVYRLTESIRGTGAAPIS